LPAAGSIILVAPFTSLLDRAFGAKLVVGAGLLLIAAGLWEISGATVTTTYVGTLAGMIMLGVGAALVIPSVTASVMGSLPADHTGIGAATNSAFLQIGGALGVAVIGSQFATRYQGRMVAALAPYHFPADVESTILGSVVVRSTSPRARGDGRGDARRLGANRLPQRHGPGPPDRRPGGRGGSPAGGGCPARPAACPRPHPTRVVAPPSPPEEGGQQG